MSEPTEASGPAWPASSTRYKIGVAVALAAAAGAFYLAASRTETDRDDPVEVTSRPDVVERLIPFSGASILRQQELGVDLAPGYEGTLFINGIEIPADEQRRVPEQNAVYFTPGEGKTVEELQAGPNCVVAVAWKSSTGRGVADEPFRWCFDAT
ncbi:MAG: hypothetical protein M3Z03_07515 [Actinomycetota bacterium]|nr:hypothetical protein [Actinomycetota bacterium]